MKIIFNLLGFAVLPLIATAQIEKKSIPLLDKVSNLTYATTNADNQITSKTFYEVTSTFNSSNGRKAILLANEIPLKDPTNSTYNSIEQDNALMTLDIKSIIPAFMFDSYSNMQIKLVSGDFKIPVQFKKNQELPNVTLTLNVTITPIIHTLEYRLEDRSVVKEESISTPAGTFECVLIESKTHILPKIDKNGYLKQWFAPGIGLIKQMHFDEKGEMTGYTLLTGINTSEAVSTFAQN